MNAGVILDWIGATRTSNNFVVPVSKGTPNEYRIPRESRVRLSAVFLTSLDLFRLEQNRRPVCICRVQYRAQIDLLESEPAFFDRSCGGEN